MKKYIADTITKLNDFANGMKANPADWGINNVELSEVQSSSAKLTATGNKIQSAEAALKMLNREAVLGKSESLKLYEQCKAFAKGIYSNNPEKLAQYGIKLRKQAKAIPPPSMNLTVVLKNDEDGKGFIVKIRRRDLTAKEYIWERGENTDPKITNVVPKMSVYKLTQKVSFVDDDVSEGIRYFYRVRAVNCNGEGPWSEAASIVQ